MEGPCTGALSGQFSVLRKNLLVKVKERDTTIIIEPGQTKNKKTLCIIKIITITSLKAFVKLLSDTFTLRYTVVN